MPPTISVIIPTYKHRAYVLEALASVFAQSFTDYEIVVVNDGSPDDTAALLAPLAADGRIRYFEQANAGQAAARNRGIAEARGEFIALVDDDDLLPADKLEWQMDILRQSDAVMVGGWVSVFGQGPVPFENGPREGAIQLMDLAEGNPFFSPGQTLIRRSALEEIGGFDATVWGADDFDLYLKLAKAGTILCVRRLALNYRIHEGNASRHRARMYMNSREVVRRHFPGFANRGARKAHRWLYSYSGRDWINQLKQSLKEADAGEMVQSLKYLSMFGPAAFADPRLALNIFLDLLPESLRRCLPGLERN